MTERWRLVRARDEPAPESVRRFALRARRRRLRALVPWLVALGVVLVLAIVAGVICFTGLMGVRRIEVTGTAITTVAQVEAAAAVELGSPLARVNPGAIAARIGRLPPVRSATVSRDWPSTLVINVTERIAVAVVPVTDATGYLAMDDTGVAFTTLSERPGDLPVVRVSSPSATDVTTKAALTVLAALPPELLSLMSELVAEAPARIRLELTDGREIVWGDSTENEAKARVAIVLLERPGNVLDVSAPNLVTVR